MSRAGDLSLLLEVSYMIYSEYHERYRRGTVSQTEARWKIGISCRSIAKYKQQCQEELQPEEYPKFYFWDPPTELPDSPTVADTNVGRIDCSSLPSMWNVTGSDAGSGDYRDIGYQYSIFDYKGFINPM